MIARCERLSKWFGPTKALQEVSFSISAGEVFALCGPNGSGKSTCLQIMSGLLRPSEGSVSVLEQNPARDWRVRRRIGFAGEPADLPGELTVEEALWYLARLRPRGSVAEVDALLDAARLTMRREALIRTLSEGMRRKCAVLLAFVGSPDLLLLDEPTSGLDGESQETFADLIRSSARRGAAVIVGTHDTHLLQALHPLVLRLEEGRVVRDEGVRGEG